MVRFLKKYFPAWNWFELLWLGTFSAVAVFISIWSKDNWLGFFTFITGVLCVALTAKGSIYSFYWGYANIISYAKRYDIFFLCGDDIPYADTPDRSGDQKRHEFQQIIIQDLQQRKIAYTVLTGTLAERI